MFHPEVFGDDETFNKFMQLYLLHHTFRNETIQSYHNGRSPTFDYNLNNKIYDNIEHKYDKTRRNKNIKHTIDITINLNNQEEETRQDARVKYKQIYDRIRQRIHKQFPSLPSEKNPQLPNPTPSSNNNSTQSHDKSSKEKYPQLPPGLPDDPFKQESPITSNSKIKPRKITNLKQVDDYLKQQEKQIKRHHRQIQKNLDNCVSWRREMMKTKNKPQYKRWNWTPNDATRHTCNDGQIVPLDKKFIVVNEKTGEVDYLNYPGDWSGSPANVYNCLCEIDYDNNITDDGIDLEKIPKYKNIKKEQNLHAYRINKELNKQKVLKNLSQEELTKLEKYNKDLKEYNQSLIKNNTHTQQELQEEYIKRNGKLPDYIKDPENEVLFQEHEGKIYLSHQFGGKPFVTPDTKTKKFPDQLYNNISKEYNANQEAYLKLDDNLKETIDFYTGDDFTEFNAWKRQGITALKRKGKTEEDINDKIKLFKHHEKNLNKLIVPLKEDMILYRGQGDLYHAKTKGTKGTWNSFTSTAMGIGPPMAYGQGNYIYEIHAPKGTPVIPILQQGDNQKELEMLLPAGQNIEVENTRNEMNTEIITVKLI